MEKPSIVFSDFDGTLTCGRSINNRLLEIIALLEKKDIPLIIVTGRSVFWGYFLLSHFPYLKTIITEGGGVLTKIEDTKDDYNLIDKFFISQKEIDKLSRITDNLKQEFGEECFSKDSKGRITDRAIPLSYLREDIQRARNIENLLKKEGANFTFSNVHLNFWIGNINKYSTIDFYLKENNIDEDSCVFFGDSLNDESVFKNMKNTIGVSNVKAVLNKLEYRPSTILKGEKYQGVEGVYNYLSELFI